MTHADPQNTPTSDPASRRVLIVDDNQDAAEVLADALNALGHEARVAFDGPQALELLGSFTPDLALIDIGLPVMDGYELAGRLREHPNGAQTVLVALTGYGQESARAATRAAGFAEHLVKPIDLAVLERTLEHVGR